MPVGIPLHMVLQHQLGVRHELPQAVCRLVVECGMPALPFFPGQNRSRPRMHFLDERSLDPRVHPVVGRGKRVVRTLGGARVPGSPARTAFLRGDRFTECRTLPLAFLQFAHTATLRHPESKHNSELRLRRKIIGENHRKPNQCSREEWIQRAGPGHRPSTMG